MSINSNLVYTIYSSHMNAESAFKTLLNHYFYREKLLRTLYAEDDILSNYNLGDRISSWGRFGAVCGWVFGMGFGVAFSIVPGVKPVIDGGPIVDWLIGALGSAVVFGSLLAFSAAMSISLLSGSSFHPSFTRSMVRYAHTSIKGRKMMNYTKPIKIKAELAIACLLWLGFGMAAQALDISFGNYDHNRDGRWNRQDYYNANREWHRNHDQHYISQRAAYRQFNNYDANHDGYLDEREVGRINNW